MMPRYMSEPNNNHMNPLPNLPPPPPVSLPLHPNQNMLGTDGLINSNPVGIGHAGGSSSSNLHDRESHNDSEGGEKIRGGKYVQWQYWLSYFQFSKYFTFIYLGKVNVVNSVQAVQLLKFLSTFIVIYILHSIHSHYFIQFVSNPISKTKKTFIIPSQGNPESHDKKMWNWSDKK